MKRTIAVALVGLLFVPALAQAQFKASDWELTLSGTGNNNHDFDTGQFSLTGSLGYFFTDQLELSFRQGVVWADGGSAWNGDSRVALDYHFTVADKLVPFVGFNAGYQYGDGIEDQFIFGPEVGIKYFLNTTTFIQLIASYEFTCQGFDQGAFYYGLGLGVRL